MAFIEGGSFVCTVHDFTTTSITEWNDHCFGNDAHTESGSTVCIRCGEKIEFENLPFHKLDATGSKNISLKCEECEEQSVGKVTRKKVISEESTK